MPFAKVFRALEIPAVVFLREKSRVGLQGGFLICSTERERERETELQSVVKEEEENCKMLRALVSEIRFKQMKSGFLKPLK